MFNSFGVNAHNIGPETQVRRFFSRPDTQTQLDKVANNCGFYYSEFEGVLVELLARLLNSGLEQNGRTLPTNKIQPWLLRTLNHTASIANDHPFPTIMPVDGYTLVESVKMATQQYPNIRSQDIAPIDNDPATLGFSGRILRSAGLITNPFQPNAVLVVSKSDGRDTLYRCQNPQPPTLETVAARNFQDMAPLVIPTSTPKSQRSSFFKF